MSTIGKVKSYLGLGGEMSSGADTASGKRSDKRIDPEEWMERIDSAIAYREEFGGSRDWSTYRDYSRGIFPGVTKRDGVLSVLPYNITYLIERVVIPSVYFRNPYVTVNPRQHYTDQTNPMREIQAKVVEGLDNWMIGEIGLKRTMRTSVLDAHQCGRGIVKIGYGSVSGTDSAGAIEGYGGWGEEEDEQTDKSGRFQTEYNVDVKPGMPWAQRVDPVMFLVPFGTRTLSNCPWVDHITLRPMEDIRRDVKYKGVKGLKGTHISKLRTMYGKRHLIEKLSGGEDWGELHEIRDQRRGELLTILGSKVGTPIRGPLEDELQIEGLPFSDMCFNEDPEFYWATSTVKIFEPQQLEINEAATQAMMHRRVALIKAFVQKGAIDPEEIMKMTSPEVMPVVRTNQAPATAVALVTPHIPPDVLAWIEAIRLASREIVGIGRPQAGETEKGGRRTAMEASIVQHGHDLRMGERRDAAADMFIDIVRKLNQVVFKFWTEERVVRVVGYDGARYWVRYSPDELKYEYDLKVDVESMTPQTKALKRRELVQLMQVLGKNPRVNLDLLMRMLLREFDWADAMRILPEAPETMGGPMGMQQFGQQQQQLLANPAALGARSRTNAGQLALGQGTEGMRA